MWVALRHLWLIAISLIVAARGDSLGLVKRVVVTGGTHGNEYTGVFTINRLQRRREALAARYPSLAVETVLANVRAHAENKRCDAAFSSPFLPPARPPGDCALPVCEKRCVIAPTRYVDEDLNRRFSMARLAEGSPATVEARRAAELDKILGPKGSADACVLLLPRSTGTRHTVTAQWCEDARPSRDAPLSSLGATSSSTSTRRPRTWASP